MELVFKQFLYRGILRNQLLEGFGLFQVFDFYLLFLGFGLLPNKLKELIHNRTLQFYRWTVEASEEVALKKHIDLINYQNGLVGLYFVGSSVELQNVLPQKVGSPLQKSFRLFQKHLFDFSLEADSVAVEDVFAQFIESTVPDLVLDSQPLKKAPEILLVPFTQIG